MKIIIEISVKDKKNPAKNQEVKLKLVEGEKEIDSFNFLDEMKLSENLLVEIDRIIRKNNLKKEDIKRIEVESEVGDNFTTPRIAKAVANSWNYGIIKK